MNQPVITSICRTPIGRFLGAYSNVPATKLGAVVVKEAVHRSKISPVEVDHVIMGHVVQAGAAQNSARQAAIFAGLPVSVGAITVNKVCASGMAAVVWAAQGIKVGDWEVVVAGGMENMTMAPYLLPKARQGYRYGNGDLIDATYHDGLYDVYNDFAMGMTGEIVAERFHITREEMDAFALRSHQLAVKAQSEGKFAEEIVPVEIDVPKKGKVRISTDEGPRPDTSLERLAKLPPAFKEGGVVTAGNASSLNDGASALVVMAEDVARERGLPILAKIVDYGSHATRPEWVMEAPIEGTRKLLKKTGYTLNDIDLVEHNEAFACASCAVQNTLEIPDEKFNVHGGAVALGHPLGCSGARILTTLYYALKDRRKRRGLATICLGGGEALTMIIET